METQTSSAPVPATETRAHHKYGPSRMEYLDHCAAFKNRDNAGNEYSEEGQLLHDLMGAMLSAIGQCYATEGDKVLVYEDTMSQLKSWVADNYTLTEEQMTWLRFCCRRCDAIIAKGPTKIHTELNVEVKNEDGSVLNHGY
jgi:hypothetical protein